MKIPQWSPLMSVHIKTPLVIRTRTQQQSPSSAFGDVEVVLLFSFSKPDRSRLDLGISIRRNVSIATSKDDGNEVTSVIVKITLVVGTNPVVDSERKAEE